MNKFRIPIDLDKILYTIPGNSRLNGQESDPFTL